MNHRLLFCLLACSLSAEEIKVDLRNPVYRSGVLYTSEGGVVKHDELRIQAKNIQYFHRMENGQMVQKIEADGDLMIQYKGKVFVGSELEFDLLKKEGVVYDGKTASSLWYIGGDQIQLNGDGSYRVEHAFITTCENKDSSWDIHAKEVSVVKDDFLKASSVRLRLLNQLSVWLPSFRVNLKKFKKEPVFKYYMNWNKGPKVGLRYQLYSWEDLALYGRVEYRWRKGWGGAFESEYFPEGGKTSFVTRSYAGTDRLFNGVDAEFRYRLQGALFSTSENDKTYTTLTWDKYSDVRMPGDFKTEEFEVNTAMKTLFYVRHRENDVLSALKVRPRVNAFESIKQDLPTVYAIARPAELKNTGIISMSQLKASYLAFDYSSQLVESLQDYQTSRVELYQRFTRPMRWSSMMVTPHLAGRTVFYGTSPEHKPQWMALLDYGVDAHFRGQRQFSEYKHIFEPYLRYSGLSNPTSFPDKHYIFSIQDGFDAIQEIALGARNLLFSNQRPGKEADFASDLYVYGFFADRAIPQVIPRAYLWLGWRLPSVYVTLDNCYNFRDRVLDVSKARLQWTVSENAAVSFEARYRSKYDWRKADHTNFILDVTRSQSELLDSPMSDRRITLLSNIFVRLNPFWEMQWESHHGFYRLYKNHLHEEPYNEFKIHLYRWLSSSWKLHLYYGYTLHNHFDWTISLKLVKKTF